MPALIDGCDEWIAQLHERNHEISFLTFLFNPLHCGDKARLEIMEKELQRFYAVLLTRVTRTPKRKSHQGRLPILISVPDRPVHRWKGGYRLSEVRPNDGVHCHA